MRKSVITEFQVNGVSVRFRSNNLKGRSDPLTGDATIEINGKRINGAKVRAQVSGIPLSRTGPKDSPKSLKYYLAFHLAKHLGCSKPDHQVADWYGMNDPRDVNKAVLKWSSIPHCSVLQETEECIFVILTPPDPMESPKCAGIRYWKRDKWPDEELMMFSVSNQVED